jgi:hypothetical protein
MTLSFLRSGHNFIGYRTMCGDPYAFLQNAQDDKALSCHAEEALSRREHLGTLVPFLLVLTEPAFGDPYAFLQNVQDDDLMSSEKDFTKKGT